MVRRTKQQEDGIESLDVPVRHSNRRKKKEGTQIKKEKEKFHHEKEGLATPVVAKTENQRKFIHSLQTNIVSVANGHAGVGKSYCAVSVAANKYLKGEVRQIVLCRPYINMGRSSGLWPGSIEDKLTPYLAPMLNVLKKRLGTRYEAELGKSIIMQPLEVIRGMSFESSFVIVDEAQNTTPEEMRSITTRLEEDSYLALIGDSRQTDIRGMNGLEYIVKVLKENNVQQSAVVEFTEDDVVRSGIVSTFVKIYEKEGIIK